MTFLVVPRRSAADTTYRGTHFLSPAWRHVGLTRATLRSWVLLEVLQQDPSHRSQDRKAQQWQHFVRADEVWRQLGVEHSYFLTDKDAWASWPSNILTSQWWRQHFLAATTRLCEPLCSTR